MKIEKYYLTKNRCYLQAVKRTPIGIQIHSIGTGQGTAKAVADYWNQGAVSACVTYVCDSDTPGKVLQLLPEEYHTWADAGYGNKKLITIEMCESDYIKYVPGTSNYNIRNLKHFEEDIRRSYQTCVELCADICKRYGWHPRTKLPNGLYLISSHDEGRLLGVSSAHVDPTHVWARFGLSMDGFRADVIKHIGEPAEGQETPEIRWIKEIAPIAQELYQETKILPSVVIAQTCLETGYGTTDLTAKCNIVGMKVDLINSTWQQWSVWDGKTYRKKTPEYYNGKLQYVYDNFRVYKSFKECLTDYEAFLLHVKNIKGLKYARIAGMTDPAQVINAIRIGTGSNSSPEGYCTDPSYETKIMNIIQKYNLTQYDGKAPAPKPSVNYRVQVGAFQSKANASKCMSVVRNASGYGCFTEKGSDGLYHVYCGSYEVKANAEERVKILGLKGVKGAFIVEKALN